jgi:hypothetical protein
MGVAGYAIELLLQNNWSNYTNKPFTITTMQVLPAIYLYCGKSKQVL